MQTENVHRELKKFDSKLKLTMGVTRSKLFNEAGNSSFMTEGKSDQASFLDGYNDVYSHTYGKLRPYRGKIRSMSRQDIDLKTIKKNSAKIQHTRQKSIEKMQDKIQQQIEEDKQKEEDEKLRKMEEIRQKAMKLAERRKNKM